MATPDRPTAGTPDTAHADSATPQQRARVVAENTIAAAHRMEQDARSEVAQAKDNTGYAISDARASGCLWTEICDVLRMARQVAARRKAPDTYHGHDYGTPDAALNALAAAFHHEWVCRRRLRQASDSVAAAVAVARQCGTTWDTIGRQAGGITHPSILRRLAAWRPGITGGLSLPAEATLDGLIPTVADNVADRADTATQALWADPAVQSAVHNALGGVALRVRTRALLDGESPEAVLSEVEQAMIASVDAGVVAVRNAAHSGATHVDGVAGAAAVAVAQAWP